MSLVIVGSLRGFLYLIDVSNIEKLKNQEEGIVTKFATLGVGISAFEMSPLPDERYFAIGTDKGSIVIYKKKYIE